MNNNIDAIQHGHCLKLDVSSPSRVLPHQSHILKDQSKNRVRFENIKKRYLLEPVSPHKIECEKLQTSATSEHFLFTLAHSTTENNVESTSPNGPSYFKKR